MATTAIPKKQVKVVKAEAPVIASGVEEMVFDAQPKVKVVITYTSTLEGLAERLHRLEREPYKGLALPEMPTLHLTLDETNHSCPALADDNVSCQTSIAQAIGRWAGEQVIVAMDKANPDIALRREMAELRQKAEAYDRLIAKQRADEAEKAKKTAERVAKMVATKQKAKSETGSVASGGK